MKKKFGISIASAIAMTLLIVSTVIGMSMAGLDGEWEFVEDTGNGSATCDAWATGEGSIVTNWSDSNPFVQSPPTTDENQVRYGNPVYNAVCPNASSFPQQSGFGFKGVSNLGTITPDTPIYLGRAAHYNNPIYVSNNLDWVDLDVTISGIMCGAGVTPNEGSSRTYVYRVNLDETPNTAGTCVYGSTNGPCDDKITISTISSMSQPITCTAEAVPAAERGIYTLQILGMIPDVGNDGDCSDTPYNSANISTAFITGERMTSYACLYGIVTNFNPTAIDLLSFTAAKTAEAVELNWETVTETNTMGFNIFRSTSRFGTQLKLNSELIFSNSIPGSILGAKYQFTDQQSVEGAEYFYWLQEVELDGTTTTHGPAEFLN